MPDEVWQRRPARRQQKAAVGKPPAEAMEQAGHAKSHVQQGTQQARSAVGEAEQGKPNVDIALPQGGSGALPFAV